MTAEQLVNHLCYEYGTKNYDEEKLKAAQELKKRLKALNALLDKVEFVNSAVWYIDTTSEDFTDEEQKSIKEVM